ncbi:MAG: hypothetical protein QOI28_3308, partial [Mycobacterium sp.]|nr:hypothetical protein [Mycobacterium sp.]
MNYRRVMPITPFAKVTVILASAVLVVA